MLDRQALFDKLLNYLQTEPAAPEYLEGQPESIAAFDPYALVSEWIALRQEIKQQNKLLLATQEKLERELAARSQPEPVVSASPTAAPTEKVRDREQETLLRELLTVVDALDRACDYGRQQAEDLITPAPLPPVPVATTLRQRLAAWLVPPQPPAGEPADTASATFSEILDSNRQGIELIRRNLLDILRQRQVTPIEAVGQPFNPQSMHAIGRQESSTVPENRVVQEVVRGYLWQQQVLREAQVIVSAGAGQVSSE